MAFSDLTATQQAALTNLLAILCPMQIQGDKFVANAQTALLANTADVTAGLAALASTDTIPNPTSLAGAQPLLPADVSQLLSDLQAVVTNFGTSAERQLRAKCAGAINLISS